MRSRDFDVLTFYDLIELFDKLDMIEDMAQTSRSKGLPSKYNHQVLIGKEDYKLIIQYI